MEQSQILSYNNLIIHPGETLLEILDDRNITQRELSQRIDVSEKHLSNVITGKKSISLNLAKKLEYALNIDSSFWINLQMNYNKEIYEFEELNNITKEEVAILSILKDVMEFLKSKFLISSNSNEAINVLEMRRLMQVSNLTLIPNLTYNAAYRLQSSNKIDVYVLFAWQRICEVLTSNIEILGEFSKDKLYKRLEDIKLLMFKDTKSIQIELTKIFAECGIAFKIVKHFKGAPVQGFIKQCDDERVILCMTIRGGYADIFWFTLFHEIGHLLNDDIKRRFIDFESVESEIEERANKFAGNILIDENDYKYFVNKNDFTLSEIKRFAYSQKVMPYIVIGRLQKEGKLDYSSFSSEKTIYKWS